jgi:1,4-alpha-glucan branching enzyme
VIESPETIGMGGACGCVTGSFNSVRDDAEGEMMSKHQATVAARPRARQHTITLESPGAVSVVVTGNFCDWKPEGLPLRYDRNGGVWKTTLTLPPGRYEYRFRVDGEWRDDPTCEVRVANPFGTQNCVFVV